MHPADAVRYLLAQGLLEAEDVVDGHLTVDHAIGRNDNLLVRSRTGRSYALKHAAEGGMAARMLALEAELYRHVGAQGASPLSTLGACVPSLAVFDAARAILVTRLAPDTREIWELDAPHDALPALGSSLGAAAAACHAVAAGDLPTSMRDRRAPWVLGIHHPDPSLFADAWPAQVEIVRLVQASPATCRILDTLRGRWRCEALIHGDLKLSNILVRVGEPLPAPTGVVLIDWETAAAGDAAWDVGSVFQTMLWHALHTVFNTDEERQDDGRDAFAARLPLYQAELRAFDEAYRARQAVSPLMEECALWCGARLIQSAYEEASGLETPSPFALALLQLGVNVLAAPANAARDLLALEPRP